MGVLMHTFLCGTQPFEVDRVNSSSLSKYVTKVHEGVELDAVYHVGLALLPILFTVLLKHEDE